MGPTPVTHRGHLPKSHTPHYTQQRIYALLHLCAQSNHLLVLVFFAVMLTLGIYVMAKVYRLGSHFVGGR